MFTLLLTIKGISEKGGDLQPSETNDKIKCSIKNDNVNVYIGYNSTVMLFTRNI